MQLANLGLIAGLIGTAIISLFLSVLLRQNRTVMRRVEEATQQLGLKESQLRMALENMPGAMWLVDKDLRLVFANDQYKEIYGDPGGLVVPGASMVDVVRQEAELGILGGSSEGDVSAIVEERVASYKSPASSAFEDRKQDGGYVQLKRNPTADGHVISVATDVSESKKAEQELAERTNLLQAVLGAMTQGIVAFNKDLKLVTWNRRFLEIRDYPPELIKVGAPFEDLMRHDMERGEFEDDDPELGLQELVSRARRFEDHAFERQRPNGACIEVRGGPIPGGGFVSTYNDITERKRAETELRGKMDELEKFSEVAVGRELRMIQLKEEINSLLKQLGRKPVHEIAE